MTALYKKHINDFYIEFIYGGITENTFEENFNT